LSFLSQGVSSQVQAKLSFVERIEKVRKGKGERYRDGGRKRERDIETEGEKGREI
jgi:hypothetical protein